ncbi:sigma-70 family RNA polymerase sigma factor [bacterium]|nr:sigma-70 family RNA polymerase sigma factor [bacterium]
MQPTDSELIQAAAGGDRSAFADFVRRHTPALLRYCLGRLRQRHPAEDATQEAMLRLFQKVQTGDLPKDPAALLFGIARNCCREQQRQRTRHQTEPLHEAEHEDERPVEMADLLELLSDRERSLILMKHTEGLKCREIAQRLGTPLGTVTAALSRAYAKLRQHLTGKAE